MSGTFDFKKDLPVQLSFQEMIKNLNCQEINKNQYQKSETIQILDYLRMPEEEFNQNMKRRLENVLLPEKNLKNIKYENI